MESSHNGADSTQTSHLMLQTKMWTPCFLYDFCFVLVFLVLLLLFVLLLFLREREIMKWGLEKGEGEDLRESWGGERIWLKLYENFWIKNLKNIFYLIKCAWIYGNPLCVLIVFYCKAGFFYYFVCNNNSH